MTEIVVVGAGRCGLHVSAQLAARGQKVTLIERLPEAGGQVPEPDRDILLRFALRNGVRLLAGTLAVAYDETATHTLGVNGTERLRTSALVITSGTRPATRAELGIRGDRCAGILPGSAAHHFLDSGVLLGRRPVVLGSGPLARHLVESLRDHGARQVVSVGMSRLDVSAWPWVSRYDDSRIISVSGRLRVENVLLKTPSGVQRILTDSVLLAESSIPMRNVEGAITERPGVFFCHTEDEDNKTALARRLAHVTVSDVAEYLAAQSS
jgi:hypothetical protein